MEPSDSILLKSLQSAVGDDLLWGRILDDYRGRLRALVELRLNAMVRRRVDPSDILQEAMVDASRRLPEYLRHPEIPFYVWLRSLTKQRIAEAHRRNLGAQQRDMFREVSIDDPFCPTITSADLAARLVGHFTSPSHAAMRIEQRLALQVALEGLSEIDREILVMRHFEELSNSEAAAALGLKPTAANNRYLRALTRLRAALEETKPLSTPGSP